MAIFQNQVKKRVIIHYSSVDLLCFFSDPIFFRDGLKGVNFRLAKPIYCNQLIFMLKISVRIC